MKHLPFTFLALLVVLQPGLHTAFAQGSQASQYAGEDARAIKALSPEEIAAYRAGEGMGYARAAELNHYPGPRHVLDLGAEMGLTDSERARMQGLFDEMRTAAVALGEQIIEREAELDAVFAGQNADAQRVEALVRTIGELEAQLRFVHLETHLKTRRLLTPEQVARYDAHRGYAMRDEPGHDHSGMQH